MQVSYLGILTLSGLVGGGLAFVGVYLDARGRHLSTATQLLLATAFGAAGFAGFLVPYVYEQRLSYVYFRVLKPQPIVVSPYEWLVVSIATGVLVGGCVAVLYVAGARPVLSPPDGGTMRRQ